MAIWENKAASETENVSLETLRTRGYTCVIRGEGVLIVTRERGLKPLLSLLESGMDVAGCHAFDRIVGKAAAALYVQLGVSAVSACVMTYEADRILNGRGIETENEVMAEKIFNRTGTGICPMEEAVFGIVDLNEAIEAIKVKARTLF